MPCAALPGAAPAPVCARTETSPALPENWEARSLLRETIFAPIGDAARHARVIVSQSNGGGQVSFRVDAQSGALYLVFANQEGRSFPVAGAGTFIIKRSLKDGSFLHAKVFVQNDPGCFLRLYPSGDRTVMDVFLAGEPFLSQVDPARLLSSACSPRPSRASWTSPELHRLVPSARALAAAPAT